MNHANALVADLVVSQPKVKFLLAYFGVAFGFTWLFWGLAIAVSTGQLVVPLPMFALMVLGGLGPMVAAIAMTALEQGARGVRDLFGQLLRFRVRWKWYVVALVLLPFLRLLPAFSHLALGGELPAQALTEQLMALPFFFVFVALLGGGLDEEMGWRGYALPRLQHLFSPMRANLMLGLIWSAWHIPLWFIAGTSQSQQSFFVYLIATTALSFVLGWMYNSTKGSLLLAVLAHTASNLGDNFNATVLQSNTNLDLHLVFQLILAGGMVLAAVGCVVRTQGTLARDESRAS